MTSLRCVVFDIDDTLFLERDYARSGFLSLTPYARERWSISDFGERAWELFLGGARGDIFDRALEAAGVSPDPEGVRELVQRYRRHAPRIELLPDAAAVIHGLSSRVRLAAISDGPLESQRAKALALGLDRWMDPIVLTAELGPGRGKPAVDAFLRVQEVSGAEGAACVYVGDNPAKDFVAPRRLGWRTVRVRRPSGLHHDVPSNADVDFELEDLTGLAARLGVTT